VLLVQLNVQHEALRAYWRWVGAGEEIRVFEELLEIAEARQIGLTREVQRRRARPHRADRERTEPAAPPILAGRGQAQFRHRGQQPRLLSARVGRGR
jgi:hypothetical protein